MRSSDDHDDDPVRLLTTREVADRFHVDPVTVQRWYHSGRLPGVRVGPRLLRFRSSDVDALAEES